jgi:2,3-bisphosphoglycerate-independent phosphoglycerate mutase
MRTLILFLDGVGLGPDDPETNPFVHARLPTLQNLLGGRRPTLDSGPVQTAAASLIPLDATLGVPGLPQSGTGQTTLLTGVNAARHIGRHLGPYPDESLRQLLAAGNLFKAVLGNGGRAALANAYPDRYLSRLERGRGRMSAIGRAAREAGLVMRGYRELRQGRAVSGLLTHEHWQSWGYELPDITPHQAGQRLAALTADYTLTFFEYFYTDVCGHRADRRESIATLESLDAFLAGILSALSLATTTLLVVSDHGNIEDWRSKHHTRNPALTLLVGAGHAELAAQMRTLADVTPALLRFVQIAPDVVQ